MTPPLDDFQTLVMVLALSAGIVLTRFSPFLLFRRGEKLPGGILYLGGALPHASMTLLLVYCLKDVSLFSGSHGLPEVLGILFTAGVYLWRRNILLGIAGGTLFHMALVQFVFI